MLWMRRFQQQEKDLGTRGSCTWVFCILQRIIKFFSTVVDELCNPKWTFLHCFFRYGYVTNSKVKFVMVVDSSNTALRDNEIRSMFRKLHNSYTDVMCNPFYNPGDPIQSKAFDSMVSSMMVQL
ncbi:trafficking protein particle complex subunit 2-like protein isoform X2 [Protopterus annectens]|uniref:trafficking protein particle complex subunit 2-like protein isoform X2 n=1 Tax=Protopterus annectens TaxID=7888 RepID=UPI001CFA7BFC|nr:trafficking protein particle complex subunit 2-like protein isoform X2 [Protopterus annectens]